MRIIELGKSLELCDIETPRTHKNESVVRVESACVCHADLHLISRSYILDDSKFLTMKERGIKPPNYPVHEITGRIEQVGGTAA
jgi:D-arabinose 1-dehydrogenase-like Zn-dependent alcohol dehydrogenase